MPYSERSTRLRGRRAVELRKARLKAEPLCRHCLAKGIVRQSVVPDHIHPLEKGGVEDGRICSPNIQCLCAECHDAKTRRDFGWRDRVERDPRTGLPLGW